MNERLKSLLVLGREHYERGEYDRAELVFQEILGLDEDRFADVHNMLAFILHTRGDLGAASRHFERAIEINPRYVEALLNLAVTYSDLGKYDAAHGIYARIRELEGMDKALDPFVRGKIANMHADIAQAYAEAGCREEAIAELRKAIDLCPTFADLHLKLGNLYRDGGNLTMAREHYASACTVNPRYVPARVLLGVTLFTMGDFDDAMAEWRAALSIEPDNKNAQMYIRIAEARQRDRGKAGAAPGGDGALSSHARPILPKAMIDDVEVEDEPTIVVERPSQDPSSLR